jgi:hypothetical protein
MEAQTTVAGAMISLVTWICYIVGFLGTLLFFPSVIAGIILFAISSNEAVDEKKKSLKKWGLIFLILPFAMIIFSIAVLVVVNFVKNLLGN